MSVEDAVAQHYSRTGLYESIVTSLVDRGVSLEGVTVDDLAPVDEFHLRGREATAELAVRTGLAPGTRVIDMGCGIGGSARYLAANFGAEVTGVDLTPEFVSTAEKLSALVGLDDRTTFVEGSATALPVEDGSFDCSWTEHVQMNIADKAGFYGEAARVIRHGGKFVCYDIFRGETDGLLTPVPWSEDGRISYLSSPGEVRAIVSGCGLELVDWVDVTVLAQGWAEGVVERLRRNGVPRFGLAAFMGDSLLPKLENMAQNLGEGRIVVAQAVWVKL